MPYHLIIHSPPAFPLNKPDKTLLPACILVSFLWLLLIEKYSWKKALLISVIMFVCVYGIFRLWLNVPFPKGLLNISL